MELRKKNIIIFIIYNYKIQENKIASLKVKSKTGKKRAEKKNNLITFFEISRFQWMSKFWIEIVFTKFSKE